MKTKHYYSVHNIATRVSFSTQASVQDSNHYDVDRIFVGFPESYTVDDSWMVRSSDGGQHEETKGLITPPPR